MDRAFSDLTIRSVDEEKRILRGVATSPRLDRAFDRIAPLGCTFTNPCVMLLQHSHDRPVGTVIFDTPTQKGVTFTAHIPKITEPGILKDRTDEAWQSVRSKILRHVSIGFRPTKPPIFNEDGGYDYPAVELYELSLCSVPCQPDAEILEVRRAKRATRVVRTGIGKTDRVVRLNPLARAQLNGSLKINVTRHRPGDPIKIVRTRPKVVKLDRTACTWLDRSKEPLRVVKLTPRDHQRARHRVVKLGRR
jgi:HK97 family phage prohead protease